MKTMILMLAAGMLLVGCAKDGAGSHLAKGGEAVVAPTPTDGNLPGPDR